MESAPAGNIRLADSVAVRHPGCRAASGMAGDAISLLARLKVQGKSEHRAGLDRVVDRVRVDDLALGDRHGRLPVKSEFHQSLRVDTPDTSRATRGKREGGSRDGELGLPKGVRDLDAEPLRANGHAEGLAESRALELSTPGLLHHVSQFLNSLRQSTMEARLWESKRTKGAGGRLFGSTSWGMDVHVGTQW